MTHDVKEELKGLIMEAYQAHSATTSNLWGDLQKRVSKIEKLILWVSGVMVAVNVFASILFAMSAYVYKNDQKHLIEIQNKTNEYTIKVLETHDSRLVRLEESKSNDKLRTQP